MPHYLVHISAPPGDASQILDQPRTWLKGMRAAARELGGHLDGCWFSESDEQLIGLLHLSDQMDGTVVRDAFARVGDGADVSVQSLLTLQEINRQPREEDVLLREELWSDPVDLGSDLSFPASDPPGWMNQERVTSEKTPYNEK